MKAEGKPEIPGYRVLEKPELNQFSSATVFDTVKSTAWLECAPALITDYYN